MGWGQDKEVLLDAGNSPYKPVVSQGLSFWGPLLPHPVLHDAGLRVCPCKTCGCIPGLYTPLDVTAENVTRPCPCALGAGLRPADLGFTPPPLESPGHTPAPRSVVSTACLTFQRYVLLHTPRIHHVIVCGLFACSPRTAGGSFVFQGCVPHTNHRAGHTAGTQRMLSFSEPWPTWQEVTLSGARGAKAF